MGWTTEYDDALPFVANEHSLQRAPGRQIAWDNVPPSFGGDAFTVTLAAAAAIDATSLTVVALPGDLPIDTLLHFGEVDEFARLTAPASEGDTTLTVEALPSALEDGDTATYYPGKEAKRIPAGTIMAALSSGKLIPRSAVTGAETATHILEASANEEDLVGDLGGDNHPGYGVIVGGVIYENLLPDFADADFATWQGELETAGVGTGWVWETYSDDTV